MTIDFVEEKKNELDFQPENNIDFQPQVIEGHVEKNVTANPYDDIINNPNLTKEQKVQAIKARGDELNKDIDRKHKIEMAKIWGGGALQIASAAIPFGGAARIGGQLALRLAKPAFSQVAKRVIAKNIGSGIASGLASGAMFGAGQGFIENKDAKGIIQETGKGALGGAIGGAAIGGVAGKLTTKLGKTSKRMDFIENKNSLAHKEVEETKTKLLDLLNKRRASVDLSKFEASRKINDFVSKTDEIAQALNVDSTKLREIMPFLRENTDLPVSNFNREDLRLVYNNLKTEQKEVLRTVAQKNFDDMEVFWKELSAIKGSQSSMSPEEYITHIWDLSNKDKEVLSNYFRTKSQFEKGRKIPTYKEGIENGLDIGKVHIDLKPKTLDYAEIQKLHSDQLIEATENTKFFDKVREIKLSNGKTVEGMPEFQDYLQPAMQDVKRAKEAKGLAGKLLEKAGNSYDMVNNFAKGCKFLFNGMHAVALTESSAAHSTNILPFKTIKTLGNIPKIIDGIKNNNYELFKNTKLAKQAIEDGVQFGAISDVNVGEFNTFMDGFAKVLDKVTFGASKIATKPLQKFVDTNNKFLWNYLHNTYKLHTYETLIKRVSKGGKEPLADNVRKDIAQLVNDTFGGQNWDGLGIKPSTLKTAQRIFLSPDWNMSATIRQSLAIFSSRAGQKFLNKFAQSSKFGAATRELSRKLGLSSFVNDVEGAGVRGKQARRYFMMFLAQTAIYSNALNACCRTIDYFKDKEKYPNGIKNLSSYDNNRFTEKDNIGKKVVDTMFPRPFIHQNEYGREIYARIGKQALEIPELVENGGTSIIRKTASKTAPLISPVATKLSDEMTNGWNKASIPERYKETFTPFTLNKKGSVHPIDAFYSTTKGINAYQARAYLKECIKNGDTEAIEKFKPKMKANKIDFDRAMRRVYMELEEE